MNKLSLKILKHLAKPHVCRDTEYLYEFRCPGSVSYHLQYLEEAGYIEHVLMGREIKEDNSLAEEIVPIDAWIITPKGLDFLENSKHERRYWLVPVLISVLSLITSIIALLKP